MKNNDKNNDSDNDNIVWTAHLTKSEYDLVSDVFNNSGKSREEMLKLLSLFTIAKSANKL